MSVFTFEKISRESVTTQVYESIKERILEGELPPGTHLIEKIIAEQTGTSRGPIREAIRQLEADGLVEVRANVGTFIRSLPLEEIKEIYTVRSLLEGLAAKLAAERTTSANIVELKQIFTTSKEYALNGNLRETVKLDLNLHRKIWELSKHQILYELLNHLEARVRMFIFLQAHLFEQLGDSIQDHYAIIEAIAARDGEKASDLIQAHILEAGFLIVQNYNSQEERETSQPI